MTTALQQSTVRRRLVALAVCAPLAVGLGACSGDDESDSTSSSAQSDGSSSSAEDSNGEDAPGEDQSAELFEAYSNPKPLGRATDGDRTLEVFEVRSTGSGTRLAFHIRGEDSGEADIDARNWSQLPTLVDRSGKTAFQPLTVTQPEYETEEEQKLCVCTGQGAVGSNPRMQHILYEEIPEEVSSVEVTYGEFDPIRVKVDR